MASKEDRAKRLANNRAFRKGQAFGIEFCITTFAFVMLEILHEDAPLVQKCLDAMEDFCLDFARKNLNLRDMQEALHDEHGVTVRFGRRETNETDHV